MATSISRTGKSRGRPSTGSISLHLRVLPIQLAALDRWIAAQPNPRPTRPEAIRRLVETALLTQAAGPWSPESAAAAKAMAEAELDKALAKSRAPEPVKQSRKKKLTKVPKELRVKGAADSY